MSRATNSPPVAAAETADARRQFTGANSRLAVIRVEGIHSFPALTDQIPQLRNLG
jgi:hypothetical protein